MKRALAFVVAVAMVAGALWARGRLDDEEERRDTVLRLVCVEELVDACDRIRGDAGVRVDLTVEPAGVTAARLSTGPPPPVDGWLAPAPWPVIVDDARRRSQLEPLFADPGRPVARSPLVIAMWRQRADALRGTCPEIGWRCLGEAAGRGWAAYGHPEWGAVKPAHGSPDAAAVGLLVLGHAVASFFGRTGLATIDLDETPGFDAWFTGLERAVPSFRPGQLGRMLAQGPSAFDAVGTTEAEAAPLLERAARGDQVALLYPAPMATADLVLAPVRARGGAGAALTRIVRGDVGGAALVAGGWRVPGRTGDAGAAGSEANLELPASAGLPSAGLLDALRARWREVTR